MTRLTRQTGMLVLVAAGSLIVFVACDRTADREPGPEPLFVDISASAGITHATMCGTTEKRTIFGSTGCGGAVLDFDGDGWMDLYFARGRRTLKASATPTAASPSDADDEAANRLYRNRGDGTFADVTAESGAGDLGWGQAAVAVDYNGDGDADLFVTNIGSNSLLKNNGDGTFTDVTVRAGLADKTSAVQSWSTGAAFADVDRDGDLDLFVAGYVAAGLFDELSASGRSCTWSGLPVFCGPAGLAGERDWFYRQDDDGTFHDASREVGLHDVDRRYGLQPVFFDYDLDGDVDLYVANDSNANALFLNDGKGVFHDEALLAGVAYNRRGLAQAGMGVVTEDLNGDLRPDIYVTNFDLDTNTLYINAADGIAEDRTRFARLAAVSHRFMGWGAAACDIDNDGDTDLYSVNGHVFPQVSQDERFSGYEQRDFLFVNDGSGRFNEIASSAGLSQRHCGRGVLQLDIDNDGGLDIVLIPLDAQPIVLQNRTAPMGEWLKVLPIGTGRNRDAVGAKVRVTIHRGSETLVQVREVKRGEGYFGSHDPRLHFGLGAAPTSVDVEVTFPSGRKVTVSGVEPQRLLEVEEGGASRVETLKPSTPAP